MGSLGCPLCCQQNFESVGTLREHLIYYLYRPLQCGVCCLHLAGIQEFIHHLRCHLGDELPVATKQSSPKPSLPVGGETNNQDSPLPLATATQDGAGADSDAGIGTAHLSDDFSSYMKGSDTANQLLKLREWRLEKLGKNFSRHRASFGRSPGVLELSPLSGRLHRSSPPTSIKDLARDRRPSSQNSSYTAARDRRPSSQNSSYTARSDVPSLGKDIDSVERCDSSATPLSVYGNVGSVEISDHSVFPQSVEKEVTQEYGFHSPAQPVSLSHGAHSYPSKQTTSCTVKQVGLAASLEERAPSPFISESETLFKNMSFQGCNVPDSNVSCNVDMNQQPRSPVSSPSVPTTQEVASCSLQPSKNEFETVQDYNICETNFAELLSKTPVTDNDVISSEQYESNRLPLLEEFSGDVCPQYHELQPVCYNREQRFSDTVSRLSDIWESCPNNSSATVCKPVEASNKSPSKVTEDSYTLIDSHFSVIQDHLSSKLNVSIHCYSDNDANFHSEEVNSGEKVIKNTNSDDSNLHHDALKKVRNHPNFSNTENCSALHCLNDESQTVLGGGCEEPYSLVDTKPYLHKKFHHDQERKVSPSAGVDQVTDVSQYINSFQSVLVRKLNGTLSTNIPMTASICTASMINPEKDIGQVELEEPHQIQSKEHICEACHKVFNSLSALQLHGEEHEKGENVFSQDLYRKCPKDPCKAKQRMKNKYQCDQCSKVFPKSFSISRHMREVHAIRKSFMCIQCNKAFSSKRHLQEHSGIHKDKKIHQCLQCHHVCYTASGLRTHTQEIHSKLEQRVYSCEICGEKFTKIYGLKRHSQRKHNGQQLSCKICSKNFACKEDLNRHSKSHVDIGLLKCDTCDKTFTTSWALQRHSKVHQSSPQHFKCNLCNLSFTRKDSLVSHSHAHSQKKPFVCHCGKRFVKKSQLKEHQDKHSIAPKYPCSVCKRSFKFKVSLKNHSCKKKNIETE